MSQPPLIPQGVILGAQASNRKWGVPASFTIAQWAVEGNWGRAVPDGSNNPFGQMAPCVGPPGSFRPDFPLDGKPTVPYVAISTWEVLKGKKVHCLRPLRAFASYEEAFDTHGKLLATGTAYAYARSLLPKGACPTEGTVEAYAKAVADGGDGPGGRPGYATAPNYAEVIISIMRRRNLYQYNS